MKVRNKINLDELKGTMYFMSDLHLGHKNILAYDHRPFETVEEMDESILSELGKIGPEDIVVDLGDMFWEMKSERCKEILDNIKPKAFYKCVGNHDKDTFYFGMQATLVKCFTQLSDIIDFRITYGGKNYKVTCCHYPILDWNHKFRGGIMVHGHTHGTVDEYNNSKPDLRIDVGYHSEITLSYGNFLVPFPVILDRLYQKTGGMEFYDWAQNKYRDKAENEEAEEWTGSDTEQ